VFAPFVDRYVREAWSDRPEWIARLDARR
jgi:hypothetical protein